MSKTSPEQVQTVLAKLGIEVKDGKVNKKEVIAALDKIKEATADTMESGHLTDEKHNKVLDAIAEWRDYIEEYDSAENKMARDMALKALDCAAHCLSMAADSCKELQHDEDEENLEENLENLEEKVVEVIDLDEEADMPPLE